MTPASSRVVRGALLAVLLALVVSVTLTLKRRIPAAAPSPAADVPVAPAPDASAKPDVQQIQYRSFVGNREAFVLRAASMVGDEKDEVQLSQVQMDFVYVSDGEAGQATITADACNYTQRIQKAVFRGNVVVTGQDGMEMRTERLLYRGDRQVARTDDPVAFRRKALSGTAVGMEYAAGPGIVELHNEVSLTIDDPDDPLTTITADKATLDRSKGRVRLFGNAVLRRPGETLTAQRLVAELNPDQTLARLEAEGGMELVTAGGADAGGPPGAGRHLVAQRLDMEFDHGRMTKAMAGPDADLTMEPATAKDERQRLKGKFITFVFDERGLLSELQANKDALLRIEPPAGTKADVRELTSRTLSARVEPDTGQIRGLEFSGDAVFTHGDRKATARQGSWVAAQRVLELRRQPALVDADGSRLSARDMNLNTSTGDILATGQVRHEIAARKGGGQAGLLGGASAATAEAETFIYDAAKRTARYQGGAYLRSGDDQVQGGTIVVSEAGDTRTLEAETSVKLQLTPRSTRGAKPVPLTGTASRMRYDEKKRNVQFEGETKLQQGDVVIEGPHAIVHLGEDRASVERLVAGEPVVVQHGQRKATGTKATWLPAEDNMVIVGDRVVLQDPGQQQVVGRSVTFHLENNRILVDGQDVARTEMRIFGANAAAPVPKTPSPQKSP